MPDTTAYLMLGVAVTLIIVVGYSASMVWRFRQSAKLIETLKTLNEEQ